MLLPPHPTALAPLRASSSLAARLRLPLQSCTSRALLLSRSPRLRWPPPIRAHASGEGGRGVFGFDALISVAELLCLGPPAICSVVCVVRLFFAPGSTTSGPPLAGGRLLVVQYVLLVGAVAIGSLIRRRQSGRLRPAGGGVGQPRMEKVEESVRGMVAAVGVLSRTVEKLGLRFRVLRRTLRDPISETAALAQKNSEATRILAAHEDLLEKEIGTIQKDLLEKEIGTIQKALYAMQERQKKQLDLILAIGEASRMLGGERGGDSSISSSASSVPEMEKENKQAETNSEVVTGGDNKPDIIL